MVPISIFFAVFCTVTLTKANSDFDKPAVYQITEPVDHAEEPTWDGRKNILYYVDIHTGRVFSYCYHTTKTHFITLNGDVTPVIPSKHDPNVLVVGLNRSIVSVAWDGKNKIEQQRVIANLTPSNQFPTSRVNDGKADSQGRLWIGTMGGENTATGALTPNNGFLYKLTKGDLQNPVVEIAPVNISNGLAWNKADDKFYYIDSPTRKVVEYQFDSKRGNIYNRSVVFDLSNHPSLAGVPDGMTIDDDNNLWVALYGGGSVIKINPKTGQLLQQISIPARDVTSTMWGGPNLDILFVTTSRVSLTENEKKFYPAAGSVFAITKLKSKGRPVFNVDLV